MHKGRGKMGDTKVMHPVAASYWHAAARTSGATAALGAKNKWRTFARMVAATLGLILCRV